MIYDFVYGALQTERGERIIPHISELLGAARQAEKPVVFVGADLLAMSATYSSLRND